MANSEMHIGSSSPGVPRSIAAATMAAIASRDRFTRGDTAGSVNAAASRVKRAQRAALRPTAGASPIDRCHARSAASFSPASL